MYINDLNNKSISKQIWIISTISLLTIRNEAANKVFRYLDLPTYTKFIWRDKRLCAVFNIEIMEEIPNK